MMSVTIVQNIPAPIAIIHAIIEFGRVKFVIAGGRKSSVPSACVNHANA